MKTSAITFVAQIRKPEILFCTGWALLMLSLLAPLGMPWGTFIHMWRVELAASLFLLITLSYLISRSKNLTSRFDISRNELYFVALPMFVFILWSAASISWAPSWKSAVHHTLVWIQYLIFYLIVRHVIDRDDNYKKLLTTLVFTLVLLSIPATLEYCAFLVFGGGTTLGIRFAKYGEQINMILPLALVGVLRLHGKRFVFGLLAITLMWLLIFCSLGRINNFLFVFATLGVAGFVVAFERFQRYRQKMAIVIATIALAPASLHLFSLLSETPNVPIVDRVSNSESISSSNNLRKLMATLSLEMMAANPILGIGADNFGMEVNKYRAAYGARNPADVNLANAENEIPERAHNEFLQIAAELGTAGAVIFLWFLGSIVVMGYKALKNKPLSPVPYAALLGLVIFLVSSLVSSYSFRLIQNGFLFFFVLAVAGKLLLKDHESNTSGPMLSGAQFKYAYTAGIICCLGLAAYSTIRVSSVVLATRGNYTHDMDEASHLYQMAMRLDSENPDARNNFGMRLLLAKRYSEAAPYLAESIKIGRARSCDFSYLASAQALAGDNRAAERTMGEAAALYPRSTFVLTRYAALLRANGKAAESAVIFERAKQIDERAANSWWTMINDGPQAVSDRAARSKDFVWVMELQPQTSIYAVAAERDIRFPNERKRVPF